MNDATPAVHRWPYDDYQRFVVDHLNPDLLALNDPLLPDEGTGPSR